MGCGSSTQVEKKIPPVICKGIFKSDGYRADASLLSAKIDPTSRIKVNCGSIFVKPHIDAKVDCLVLYPDPRYIKENATLLVADRVRKDPNMPAWTKGARVQVKEFDSLDDIYKDWFEAAGPDRVPGVHLMEDAGPMGAWITFSPNSYQTRFLTPSGRRMWSPMADTGKQHLSVPQRLHNVYKAFGENAIRSLCTRFSKALTYLQATLIELRTPSILTDLIFDPADAVRNLMLEFPKMDEYHTVFEFPEALSPLRDILAEMEDNLIYNWFDVSLDCDIQLGTYRFRKSKQSMSRDRTLLDRALGWCLENLNHGTDNVLLSIRAEIKDRFKEVAHRWIKPKEPKKKPKSVTSSRAVTPSQDVQDVEVILLEDDTPQTDDTAPEDDDLDEEGDNLIKCLFPDLEELVDATIASIDGEVMGLVEELPENSELKEVEDCEGGILGVLEKWRAEDEKPIATRRERFYNKTTNRLQPQLKAFNAPGLDDPDQLEAKDKRILNKTSRFPLILPKHFYEFTFFLVFPKWDPKEVDDMKCPKKAYLSIWPEGTAATDAGTQKVKMTSIAVENGGPDSLTSTAQSFANKMFQDGGGDSSIDSDDGNDPRNKWVSYPTEDWRGYEGTVTLATQVTYNFHFLLDGVIFLDHDTYSRDPTGESGECRRVRFKDVCRPYTVNPLRHSGLVM